MAFVGGCARSCRIDQDSKINQLDDMEEDAPEEDYDTRRMLMLLANVY